MSSNLKVNTILPSVGSNIGLGTNGGNLNVDGGCKVQVGTALTLGHTVGVQFATQNLHSAGFEVNQINASGIITASSFEGAIQATTGTFSDNLNIVDAIRHSGDTDTKIRFPSADTISFETGGSERLRVDATGDVGIGTAVPVTWSGGANLSIAAANGGQLELKKVSSDIRHYVWGDDELNIGAGYVNGSSSALNLKVNGNSTKLRIEPSGQINATGSSTGNPIGITIKNSNTAAYSHARLRLESQNASKYADVFCDVPNNSLRLAYNSSNSLYISQEGNVGLGTATPQNSSGYATLTVSGSTGGQLAFFGSNKKHFIWTDSDALNVGAGYDGGGELRLKTNGNNERLRIDGNGAVSLRNSTNSHQELQWYVNTTKSASIGWGNGSANWEFKHFRNDNQADNPYANIDFYTGDFSSPTRALRITNDGNHIREKHSRFATRIDYTSSNESANAKIPMKAPHVNVGNDFSDSNERFTAPVDGDYAFWFHTNVMKSGSGSYFATWYKNGSEANGSHGGRMYDQYTGAGWNNLSGCIMLNLSEGDYVELYNGTVAANYDGNSYGQFMGWLVG